MTANTYILLSVACALLIVFILLIKVYRIIIGKDRYTLQEKKTIETYGRVPKAGMKQRNAVLLFISLVALIMASCSPTASLPNGCKYKIHPPKFTK